jgi:hypothetical protein
VTSAAAPGEDGATIADAVALGVDGVDGAMRAASVVAAALGVRRPNANPPAPIAIATATRTPDKTMVATFHGCRGLSPGGALDNRVPPRLATDPDGQCIQRIAQARRPSTVALWSVTDLEEAETRLREATLAYQPRTRGSLLRVIMAPQEQRAQAIGRLYAEPDACDPAAQLPDRTACAPRMAWHRVEHMFDQTEFEVILSCGMCSQPFSLPAGRLAVATTITLPHHAMLGPMGEGPSGECGGSGLPPMRHRCPEEFESWWRRHHGDAPSPAIIDGAVLWLG